MFGSPLPIANEKNMRNTNTTDHQAANEEKG